MTGRHSPTPAAPAAPAATPGPAARETGWLPDWVFTSEKFEAGLAFFADDHGRITRFSREPAEQAGARRLNGQAALPGMVNGHAQSWRRPLRGRAGHAPAADDALPAHAAAHLAAADLYDAARMAFMEMLLSGVTCAGECHLLRRPPDGAPAAEPNLAARELLRAARDVGLRLALLPAYAAPAVPGKPSDPTAARAAGAPDAFIREVDALRDLAAHDFPGDGAWIGIAVHSLGAAPPDALKAVAAHAHAQRLRLQIPVAGTPADRDACLAEHGRTPVVLLAEAGLLDKRFSAVHALYLTDDEVRLLGAARAIVCRCPTSERPGATGAVSAARILAAGAGLAVGSGARGFGNLLAEARQVEPGPASGGGKSDAPVLPLQLWQIATATGARALGAPGGALEIGRPADFFTVNLFDPVLAGAEPDGLLANLVFGLDRRAIRDVWVGGRQVVAGGRHPYQGAIISRFVELQQRLWGGGAA